MSTITQVESDYYPTKKKYIQDKIIMNSINQDINNELLKIDRLREIESYLIKLDSYDLYQYEQLKAEYLSIINKNDTSFQNPYLLYFNNTDDSFTTSDGLTFRFYRKYNESKSKSSKLNKLNYFQKDNVITNKYQNITKPYNENYLSNTRYHNHDRDKYESEKNQNNNHDVLDDILSKFDKKRMNKNESKSGDNKDEGINKDNKSMLPNIYKIKEKEVQKKIKMNKIELNQTYSIFKNYNISITKTDDYEKDYENNEDAQNTTMEYVFNDRKISNIQIDSSYLDVMESRRGSCSSRHFDKMNVLPRPVHHLLRRRFSRRGTNASPSLSGVTSPWSNNSSTSGRMRVPKASRHRSSFDNRDASNSRIVKKLD